MLDLFLALILLVVVIFMWRLFDERIDYAAMRGLPLWEKLKRTFDLDAGIEKQQDLETATPRSDSRWLRWSNLVWFACIAILSYLLMFGPLNNRAGGPIPDGKQGVVINVGAPDHGLLTIRINHWDSAYNAYAKDGLRKGDSIYRSKDTLWIMRDSLGGKSKRFVIYK